MSPQEKFDTVTAILSLLILGVFIILITGCAALEPERAGPFAEHMSHATQHAPFTSNPQDYGANIVGVSATWSLGSRAHLELSDGINLNRHYQYPADVGYAQSYGEIMGPTREEFEARVSYDLWRKP